MDRQETELPIEPAPRARPNSIRRSGHRNLRGEWMKGKFDFAYALVVVAFLPGDMDRGGPGLNSVDEIHADRG